MLKWLEGLKSNEYLTDFVFAINIEIGLGVKVVIYSSNMNRFV